MTDLSNLRAENLIVDHIYKGGRNGNAGDDPLVKLLGVSNQGGFRYLGNKSEPSLVVLTTSLSDTNWPDQLDCETGAFTYYGDNKKPGCELHATPRNGNILLRWLFDHAHDGVQGRKKIPPVLVFASVGVYRDMRFLGLVVPGVKGRSAAEDLVAIWKAHENERFQNYRALFTVLDIPVVKRVWLESIINGDDDDNHAPSAWLNWKRTGILQSLQAEKTIEVRTADEQKPTSRNHKRLISSIYEAFKDDPVKFEKCAAHIAELVLGQVIKLNVTRPSRDGGRDAIGEYRIGDAENGIKVDFALEAKCYAITNSVGVKDVSRIISRLRHRQFGILVTTSFVGAQAYKEIKEDGHPLIIVTGRDIAKTLEKHGLGGKHELQRWLERFVYE